MPDPVLDLDYPAPEPPVDLAARAKQRARRRRRMASGVGLVGVAGAAAVVVLSAHGSRSSQLTAADAEPTASSTTPATPSPPAVLRPVTGPTAGPTGALPELGAPVGRPDSFIAFTPGGAERPTLVATDTGRTIRVLGPGAQVTGVLSPDRATLYLPVTTKGVGGFQCDARWQAITVADGRATPVPGLDGLASFALSPDGQSVATVVSPDGCGNPGGGDPERLVVRSLAGGIGRESALPAGNWFVAAWSSDTLLLNDIGTNGQALSTFDAATLEQVAVLPAPPAGCEAGAANLRSPGDVVLAQTCVDGAGKRIDLVDLDPATGSELRRVRVLSAGADTGPVYNGLGVDRSGQNIVLQCNCGGSDDGHVYLVLGSRVVDQGMIGVYGALW